MDTPQAPQIAYGLLISPAHVVRFAAVSLVFGAPLIQKRILGVRHWADRAFCLLLVSFGMSLAAANSGTS